MCNADIRSTHLPCCLAVLEAATGPKGTKQPRIDELLLRMTLVQGPGAGSSEQERPRQLYRLAATCTSSWFEASGSTCCMHGMVTTLPDAVMAWSLLLGHPSKPSARLWHASKGQQRLRLRKHMHLQQTLSVGLLRGMLHAAAKRQRAAAVCGWPVAR